MFSSFSRIDMRQALRHSRRHASSAAAAVAKPLPPLPTPLEPSKTTAYNQFNLYPSSAASEQRTILEACIAGGHIVRAKNIWTRIRQLHEKEQSNPKATLPPEFEAFQAAGKLADVIPMSVHASFLRAFFRDALAGKRYASVEHRAVDAWEWWDMLLEQQKSVGTPDAEAFAVMIKGALVTSNPYDGASPQHDQLVALLELLPKFHLKLSRVLDEPIFDSQATASLGNLKPEDALERLKYLLTDFPSPTLANLIEEAETAMSKKPFMRPSETLRVDPLEGVTALEPTYRPAKNDLDDETVVPIGLDTLRGHLASLTSKRQVAHSEPIRRQRELEESAYDAARKQFEKERDMIKDSATAMRIQGSPIKSMKHLMWEWTTLLAEKIQEELKEVQDDAKLKPAGSYEGLASNENYLLSILEPEKLAFVTISELFPIIGMGPVADGTTVATACNRVGRCIEQEYRAQVMSHDNKKAFQRKLAFAPTETGGVHGALNRMWKQELKRMRKESTASPPEWTAAMKVKLAARLIAGLIDVAKIPRTVSYRDKKTEETNQVTEVQPAFFHSYQYVRGNKLGVIKCNQALLERLEVDPMASALHPRQLPMVIPPRMWQDRKTGCYIIHDAEVMRIRSAPEQKAQLERADLQGDLFRVYEALDYLGSLPWQINKKMFNIISEVWNSGEAIADLPVRSPLLTIPDPEEPKGIEGDMEAKIKFKRAKRATAQFRNSQHSQRCAINYKLEIARAYLGETMYFPHNVDFRGRAYPIPPNLSHIGDDLSRGLLQFAEAKPLGERGLDWLKVHAANLFGYDKASFEDRKKFTEEHLDDIMDSADKPLDGRRWWLKGEDSWQLLATCLDITAAIRSPDPTQYMSRQPIHQDGTCNGLQHYAALGGDPRGAAAVNLIAGEKPSDVYGSVAALVSKQVELDAEAGDHLAQQLLGKINRKVVKQTVMTVVYGVTFIGATRMILKQIEELKLLPAEEAFRGSLYLTRLTFESIGDIFARATAIQKWFSQCARLVCRSLPPSRLQDQDTGEDKPLMMTPMIWTTPLKLPVTQPYRKPKRKQIVTMLQTVSLEDPHSLNEVDSRSQATAFPPNFVHSLDATHMMLTALECKQQGIAFASVHDSFWTHACDIDKLSSVLRKCFIDLHSQPLLDNLREQILERYKDYRIYWSDLPPAFLESLGVADLAPAQKKGRAKPAKKAEEEEVESPFLSDGDLELNEDAIARIRQVAQQAATISDTVMGQTVALSELLPPVPERGEFDVSSVSESMYFFS